MKRNLLKSLWLMALLLVVGNVRAQVYNEGKSAPLAPNKANVVRVFYYNGNGEQVQEDVSLSGFTNIQQNFPNAMAFISSAKAGAMNLSGYYNLVVETKAGQKSYSYECEKFTLTDGVAWYTPVQFLALSFNYTRPLSSYGVNSACLPFEISKSNLTTVGLPEDTKLLEFFILTPNPDNTVTLGFNQRDNVLGGQPFFFVTPESFKGATWNVEMEDVNIVPKATAQGALFGDYKRVTIGVNKFVPAYSRENLWRTIDENDTSGPFRAYCAPNWNPAQPLSMDFVKMIADKVEETNSITAADDEEKVVSEIFSINGIKQNELKDGINVVRMSNGTTKKIIK